MITTQHNTTQLNCFSWWIKLSAIAFVIINHITLYGGDHFKHKLSGLGLGPDQYKQYSMVRSNTNDGFVYSGTTKNASGLEIIHIIKTDENFTPIWNYHYEIPGLTLNSTKICPTYAHDGYWVSGYSGDFGMPFRRPFLLKIDEFGIMIDHVYSTNQLFTGVYLDVEPTEDGGCITVGFKSYGIELPEYTSNREGLICKFDASLNIMWERSFQSNVRSSSDVNYFEMAENVTVIKSSHTQYQETYFVMGTISKGNLISNDIMGYFCYIDNLGGLIYQNPLGDNQISYDAAYSASDHRIYFVGQAYLPPSASGGFGSYSYINVSSGFVFTGKLFEGTTQLPRAHVPFPYKIEIHDNILYIMGHIRDYLDANNNRSFYTMIPFRIRIDKSTLIPIDFYINHTDINRTHNYPQEDPGFLNAWDNNPYFPNGYPPLYVPEMGVVFEDEFENKQFAMVSYYAMQIDPIAYSLHFITTGPIVECDPLERGWDLFPNFYFGNLNASNIYTNFMTFDRYFMYQNPVIYFGVDCSW